MFCLMQIYEITCIYYPVFMNRPFEPYFSSCDYSRWKGLKLQIKAGKMPLSVNYIFDNLTNEAWDLSVISRAIMRNRNKQ